MPNIRFYSRKFADKMLKISGALKLNVIQDILFRTRESFDIIQINIQSIKGITIFLLYKNTVWAHLKVREKRSVSQKPIK